MENQQPKTGKFALNYGLLLAGVSIVFSLMLYFMDMHLDRNPVISVIGIAIMVAVILLGIAAFKKANSGFVTLGQAVKTGLGIAALSAVIMLVYQLIFTYGIEPDFANQVMELQRQKLTEAGKLTAEQISQQVEMGKKYFWIGFLFMMVFGILIGLVISLVGGLILKKAKPEY
ncbi:MAG: DUF4199 domain-containing protein [Sinomicrobium sp.]|nr:DUF4199 domain-containing protein [Sinomicrobium sp.]